MLDQIIELILHSQRAHHNLPCQARIPSRQLASAVTKQIRSVATRRNFFQDGKRNTAGRGEFVFQRAFIMFPFEGARLADLVARQKNQHL